MKCTPNHSSTYSLMGYLLRQKYCTLDHGNLSFSKMDRAVHLAMNTNQVSQKMKSSLYKNLGFEVNSEYIYKCNICEGLE